MKKLVAAFIALSVVTLGLTACRKNQITIVETSYMVTHPAAHNGELIVFQNPPASKDKMLANTDTEVYVHFPPGGSPCADETIHAQPGKPLQCQITANPTADTRYLFYIDSIPDTSMVRTCPPWCSVMVVVGSGSGSTSGPVQQPYVPLPMQSSPPRPADEVPIEKDDKGQPFAPDSYPFPGQLVTWYRIAPDSGGWSVLFTADICTGGKTVTSANGEVAYCTLKSDTPGGYYSYNITLPNGQPGPASRLYVLPSPTTPNPQ